MPAFLELCSHHRSSEKSGKSQLFLTSHQISFSTFRIPFHHILTMYPSKAPKIPSFPWVIKNDGSVYATSSNRQQILRPYCWKRLGLFLKTQKSLLGHKEE
jgi:hypothetical protein